MQHTYDLLHNDGVFEIIYDMTDVIDEELVRMVEDEYIKLFMMNKNFNVINIMKTNNKEKFKTIRFKVKEDEYIKALQILAEEGLIDLEEYDVQY